MTLAPLARIVMAVLCGCACPAFAQTADPVLVTQTAITEVPAAVVSVPLPLPVPVPVYAPIPTDAQSLAALLVPRQLFIDINMVNFKKGMDLMAQQAPELVELYKQYPGLENAIIQTGSTKLNVILEDEYPALSEKIAAFVAQRYLPKDLVALNAFYSGSAGRKLIEAEYATADAQEMLKAFTDADGKLTMDEVKAMEKSNNTSSFGKDLTSQEKASALKFFLGASGRKIAQNKNDFQKLTVDWVNSIIAKHQDALAAASAETILDFIQKSAKEPAKMPSQDPKAK